MAGQSLLERRVEKMEAEIDFSQLAGEARELIKTLKKITPLRDARFREKYFEPLISRSQYERSLQLAWDLLAHSDDRTANVGDELLHHLIYYNLIQKDYFR